MSARSLVLGLLVFAGLSSAPVMIGVAGLAAPQAQSTPSGRLVGRMVWMPPGLAPLPVGTGGGLERPHSTWGSGRAADLRRRGVPPPGAVTWRGDRRGRVAVAMFDDAFPAAAAWKSQSGPAGLEPLAGPRAGPWRLRQDTTDASQATGPSRARGMAAGPLTVFAAAGRPLTAPMRGSDTDPRRGPAPDGEAAASPVVTPLPAGIGLIASAFLGLVALRRRPRPSQSPVTGAAARTAPVGAPVGEPPGGSSEIAS